MWLSKNESIPWTIELIEKFKEKWDWEYDNWSGYEGLSGNPTLPWTLELIEKFNEEWDWEILGKKWYLPWTIEFIKKHEDKWNWDTLWINYGIWEKVFKENINDEFIIKVAYKLKTKA